MFVNGDDAKSTILKDNRVCICIFHVGGAAVPVTRSLFCVSNYCHRYKGKICDFALLYYCFPCLGRKESDTHDKRVVEFGKCHVVQGSLSLCFIAEQTLRDVFTWRLVFDSGLCGYGRIIAIAVEPIARCV